MIIINRGRTVHVCVYKITGTGSSKVGSVVKVTFKSNRLKYSKIFLK